MSRAIALAAVLALLAGCDYPLCKLDVADAATAIKAFKPLIGQSTDVQLVMFGDGKIWFDVEINGAKLTGRGNTLAEALADLGRQNSAIREALKNMLVMPQ